jgi:Zinc finger, C3HC4 type (RING finger)
VTVTERAFSEFPTDKCIERLRLAPGSSFCNGAGAGWISIRLNKKSPEDRLIVQYVGLDTSFDPEQAGIFHFQQACAANALATSTITSTELQPQHSALVDHARLRQGAASQHQFSHQHQVSTTPTIHEISSIDENESRSSLSSAGGGGFGSGMTLPVTTTTTFAATVATTDPHHQQQHPPLPTKINKNDHHRRRRRPDTPDNSCLICIDKTRNATMVHGDTGHIACCLDCARMLKASGQPCPVCRLPIDLVILHYWA